MTRALVALSIVLTLLGIAALTTTLRLRRDVVRLQNEKLDAEERERLLGRRMAQEQSSRAATADALERERARAEHTGWPAFPLKPGAPRAGQRSPELAIPSRDGLVILELTVPAALDADAYRAGLRSAPGDEFWMQSRLQLDSSTRTIRLSIPASALPPADYELSLQTVPAPPKREPIYYYFSVKAP